MAISIAVALHQPSISFPFNASPIRAPGEETQEAPAPTTYTHVAATVIVKLTKPTKLSKLTIRFLSRQWLDSDEDDSKCGSFTLFGMQQTLLDKDAQIVSAGLHTYDVSFKLPSWLPPSFASSTSKITHLIVAKLETPSPIYFNLKRNTRVAAQELVIIREPPTALGALRYWSGQRRSASTSLAVKTARFGRVDGKLKVSLRVKSMDQLRSCDVDIVQEETCCIDLEGDSAWHKLPGSITAQNIQIQPFLNQEDNGIYNIRRYPIPTISTNFPDPQTEGSSPDSATLSQLSLVFKLTGHDLRPDFISPLHTVSHKLRIRFRFENPESKEIVVNIPITLYEGPASCDDIPPLYEDIYNAQGRRSRASSVATLPLYVKDELSACSSPDLAISPADPCSPSERSSRSSSPEPTSVPDDETTLGLRLNRTYTTMTEHSVCSSDVLPRRGSSASGTSWLDSDNNMAP